VVCLATLARDWLRLGCLAVVVVLLLVGLRRWAVRGGGRRGGKDFVVLSHKRSGSNLLCGICHLHPEILMHNELFNARQPFSYHSVK
jgi:hypothetical protein